MRRVPVERLLWTLGQPRMAALLLAATVPDRSTGELAEAVGIPANPAASLLTQLRREGLLDRRSRTGSPGNIAMWRLTPLGTLVLHHRAALLKAVEDTAQDGMSRSCSEGGS